MVGPLWYYSLRAWHTGRNYLCRGHCSQLLCITTRQLLRLFKLFYYHHQHGRGWVTCPRSPLQWKCRSDCQLAPGRTGRIDHGSYSWFCSLGSLVRRDARSPQTRVEKKVLYKIQRDILLPATAPTEWLGDSRCLQYNV